MTVYSAQLDRIAINKHLTVDNADVAKTNAHIGLFDDLKAQAVPFEPKRILTVYKEEAL